MTETTALRVEPLREDSRCMRVYGGGYVGYVVVADVPGEADAALVRRRLGEIDASLAGLGDNVLSGIRGIALTLERQRIVAVLEYLERERGDDLPAADMRGFRYLGDDDEIPFDGSGGWPDEGEPVSASAQDRDSAGYGY